MDSDWTANALFSPSKARVQQAQAKDWAAVDAWLAKRYPSRVPTIERNEDTLQALLTLANLNESADDQRVQIERIEKAALQGLTKKQGGIYDDIIQPILLELVEETHIDTLAEILVTLDAPDADAVKLAHRVIDLTSTDFERTQQLKRAEAQLEALRTEQRHTAGLLHELQSDAFRAPSNVVETTTEWIRTTKHLKAKLTEYEERLSSSRPSTTTESSGLGQIESRTTHVESLRVQLSQLQTELQAYKDLPPNPRDAQVQLEKARDRLLHAVNRRNKMFEGLVDT